MDDKVLEAEMAVHVEKATHNEGGSTQIHISSKDQARIRGTFDCRMLPIVCILYTLSYLDRGNIGNAKTAGAQHDLGLNSSQWALVLNSFYIAYVLFEWTTLFWRLLPAHIYVSILCIVWGATAMCSGVVHSLSGLIACRVLLGIAEASFGAGAPYYLSLFYQRRELALRVSILIGMAPLANCFAGAIAYGITQISGTALESWRLLFLIEGAPTIAFAPVVFFLLPDSPGMAKFLSETAQMQAIERLQTRDLTEKAAINWKQFFAGITDYRNIVHTLIHFMCNYSLAGLSNFLPTILQGMGYSSINSQGLTAPVYFASFLCCILAAYASDRWGQRGLILALFATMGTVGYIILATVDSMGKAPIRYLGVWLAVCGVFPPLGINITWLLNNNSNESKRGAGLAVLAMLGQCSSFLSSTMFPVADAPYFIKGCAIGCAFTGFVALLSLAMYFLLRANNKKKDAIYGAVDEMEQFDVTELGDSHPRFRYVL